MALSAFLSLLASGAVTAAPASGALATSFGTKGIVTLPGYRGELTGLVMDNKGNLVLSTGTLLARTTSQGKLDRRFGSTGLITLPASFGMWGSVVATQPDGKVVVAASTWTSTGGCCIAVARYLSNGALDTSFGIEGTAQTTVGDGEVGVWGVAIQTDGKIVVAGFAESSSVTRFMAARFNADGSLDSQFGSSGFALALPCSASITWAFALATELAIQADGKILLAGRGVDTQSQGRSPILRLNADGSLDSGFGTAGCVMTSFLGQGLGVGGLGLQGDGRILAVGQMGTTSFRIARYDSTGTLDTSFGSVGETDTVVGSIASPQSVAVQRDGKIVVGGSDNWIQGRNFALVRYTAAGALDESFGTSGIVTRSMSLAGGVTGVESLVLASGRIYAGGHASDAPAVGGIIAAFNQ